MGAFARNLQTLPAIVLNRVLRLVPTRVKAPIAATAINAAINAYSIAVTPHWASIKFVRSRRNGISPGFNESKPPQPAPRSLRKGEKNKVFASTAFYRRLGRKQAR